MGKPPIRAPFAVRPALSRDLNGERFDYAGWLRENEESAVVSGAVPPQSGPVAQLGARFHGMEEVVGSIPTRSTNSPTNRSGPAPVANLASTKPRSSLIGIGLSGLHNPDLMVSK